MTSHEFTIVIERDENGVYVASCPVLQGCYSQGDTRDEAVENLKDAIRLHLEARQSLSEPIPLEVGVEKIEIRA